MAVDQGRRLRSGWSALRAGGVAVLVCLASLVSAQATSSAAPPADHAVSPPPQRVLTGAAAVRQIAPSASGQGYWMVAANGGVASFGNAVSYGSVSSLPSGRQVVGMAPTPDDHGYWLVGADGASSPSATPATPARPAGLTLNRPIVGMAPTADGRGYWLVASDGGIFAFGDAAFFGSTGSLHPQPADRGHGRHRRRRGLLAGGLRRRHLRLRRRRLPRLDRQPDPQQAGRRHGGHPRRRRLLAGGL